MSDQAPESTSSGQDGPSGPFRRRTLAIAAAVLVLVGALVAVLVLTTTDRPERVAGPATDGSGPATADAGPATASDGDESATPTASPSPTGPYVQPQPPKGSALTPVAPMEITVSAAKTGTSLAPGLIGLSLEATDLADPRLSGSNPEIVSALGGLGKPLLRFGGNAVDRRFFWTSSDEPIPKELDGDKAHPVRAVEPADLERINTLLVEADATISLTVDLGHYDPARAADMVGTASRIFDTRLVGIAVGNEPNAYSTTDLRPAGWGIPDYLAELQAYASAMYEVAPDVPIVGPGTYSESWWGPFAEVDLPQRKILAFHHYPLSDCDGAKDPLGEPLLENLMDNAIHERAQDYRRRALAIAETAGLETWIPETGVSACPGSNETTETHASALWSVDYALSAAAQGIERLSFHSSLLTCKGGPPMSAICSGGPYLEPDETFDERANYFGLSLVAELPPGNFLTTAQQGGGLAYSYALRHAEGSLSVVLVNENDPQDSAPTDLTLQLPAAARTGTMTQLAGSSYAVENASEVDGEEAPPVAADERPDIPGFTTGTGSVTLPVTAGTASVFHFTF